MPLTEEQKKARARISRARYLGKQSVKEKERERKRQWYANRKANDLEFADKEKKRLLALSKTEERKKYMMEYHRQYRAAKKASK